MICDKQRKRSRLLPQSAWPRPGLLRRAGHDGCTAPMLSARRARRWNASLSPPTILRETPYQPGPPGPSRNCAAA